MSPCACRLAFLTVFISACRFDLESIAPPCRTDLDCPSGSVCSSDLRCAAGAQPVDAGLDGGSDGGQPWTSDGGDASTGAWISVNLPAGTGPLTSLYVNESGVAFIGSVDSGVLSYSGGNVVVHAQPTGSGRRISAFARGPNGQIIVGVARDNGLGELWSLNGSTWSSLSSFDRAVTALWTAGGSSIEAYVVTGEPPTGAASPAFYSYVEPEPSLRVSTSAGNLYAVFANYWALPSQGSSDPVWFAGATTTIGKYVQGSVSAEVVEWPDGGDVSGRVIYGFSAINAQPVAVGGERLILRRDSDGGVWRAWHSRTGDAALRSIWVTSATEAYAVGETGETSAIWRQIDGGWIEDPLGVPVRLYAVAKLAVPEYLAVGEVLDSGVGILLRRP